MNLNTTLLRILICNVLAVLIFVFLLNFGDETLHVIQNQDIKEQLLPNRDIHPDMHERHIPGNKTVLILCFCPENWFNDWVGNRWENGEVFKNCPVKNCKLTKDRSFMNEADAVLFRASSTTRCMKKEKEGQVWIIFEHESPVSYKVQRIFKAPSHCYKDKYNWTLTYRRDSDFTLVHGHFSKAKQWYKDSVLDHVLRSKEKTAVGFISNCHSQSKRIDYINALRSHGVNISLYGKCGNLSCNDSNKLKAAWNISSDTTDKCFDVLDSTYKFYLSFENSFCVDYVTEKSLHLVLRHHIVPVIRDASNHSLFHPPKSYISTKDFNIKSLARRLNYLANNSDKMKEYFNWRHNYSIKDINIVLENIFCDMCQRLHDQNKYKRVYKDVREFLKFRGIRSPACHKPFDIVP